MPQNPRTYIRWPNGARTEAVFDPEDNAAIIGTIPPEYTLSFTPDKNFTVVCPFCPENWRGLNIVCANDEQTMAIIEPLDPVVDGHLLAIHRLHTPNAASNPRIAGDLMAYAADYVRDFCESANIITSIGPAATQTVTHTHIHIVPREEGDGLPLPWTPQHEAREREQAARDIQEAREKFAADMRARGMTPKPGDRYATRAEAADALSRISEARVQSHWNERFNQAEARETARAQREDDPAWERMEEDREIARQQREEAEAREDNNLIREEDIEYHTHAQAVPGGSWSIKLVHRPTRIWVDADSRDHKSQLQARAWALGILTTKLQAVGWKP